MTAACDVSPHRVVSLTAAYTDGALVAASQAPDARSPRYWRGFLDGDSYQLVELVGVPGVLAEQLCAQGFSDQHFADGYVAAAAAQPYLGRALHQQHGSPTTG